MKVVWVRRFCLSTLCRGVNDLWEGPYTASRASQRPRSAHIWGLSVRLFHQAFGISLSLHDGVKQARRRVSLPGMLVVQRCPNGQLSYLLTSPEYGCHISQSNPYFAALFVQDRQQMSSGWLTLVLPHGVCGVVVFAWRNIYSFCACLLDHCYHHLPPQMSTLIFFTEFQFFLNYDLCSRLTLLYTRRWSVQYSELGITLV